MKIDKFVVKLRNEAKANPKKAGMLALLLVVALWFWAPLLAKWFAPNAESAVATTSPAEPAASTAAETPVATSSETAAGTIKAKVMQYAWRDISNWILRDPRMAPAADLPAGKRDPFRPLPKAIAPAPVAPKAIVKEVLPDPSDFKLSSTLVGTHRKTARINGKSYMEGDQIASESQPGVVFDVTEITTRKVVLERQGHYFELKLNTPEVADKGK